MFKKEKKKETMSKQEVLSYVIESLEEKKYNTVNQLTGYLLSGDPTYITNHKDARTVISKYEREDLLELIVEDYLKNN
jgi:UPF0297 protein BH1268